MPTINVSDRDDKIALICRPDVMQHYGLHPDDRRLLYPFVLACLIVNSLKHQARVEAERTLGQSLDEMPPPEVVVAIDAYALTLLQSVEVEGYETFRARVKGEFRGSHLEEFEIHEAFDIVCQYARDPLKPMRFKFTSTEQQRKLAPMLRKVAGVAVN